MALRSTNLFSGDDGIGICQKNLPHIFDDTFSTKEAHSGIGLALCKKVLQAFDGDIICSSEKNKYTEFTIELPNQTKK